MVGLGGIRQTRVSKTFDACEPGSISLVQFFAQSQCLVYMFELQQAKGGVDFAHLAINAGSNHGDFIHKTEILEMVNAKTKKFEELTGATGVLKEEMIKLKNNIQAKK